jgi:hypothetical protein
MLRIPYCLDSWLTDGDTVVSPTHRPRSNLQKHYLSASGTHFCYRLSEHQDLVRQEGLGKLKKFIHFIGPRTCGLPAYDPGMVTYLRGFPGEGVPLLDGERVHGLVRDSSPQMCRQLGVLSFPSLQQTHTNDTYRWKYVLHET